MNELIIDAKTENLHQIFDFLTAELKKIGCDKKTIRECKLCVEEIFLNISNYSYNPEVGKVRIKLDVLGKPHPAKLIFSFSDTGKPFDPLSKEAPDIEAPLNERPIGGLGIFLVTSTMDDVSYEYKDGQNILTIEKAIKTEQPLDVLGESEDCQI